MNGKRQITADKRTAFLTRYAQQWEDQFQTLLAFFYTHSHTRVVRTTGGDRLYNWVQTQRHMKRKGLLSAEREARLNSVEFVWYCGGQRYCWAELYQQLAWYHEAHGDCLVNYEHYRDRDAEYGYLALWVHCLRIQHRRGGLGDGKFQALEALDFHWGQSGPQQRPWLEMYGQLCQYKAANGHLNVRQTEDLRLFHWTQNQRSTYKGHKKGQHLSTERIQMLEALGFRWEQKLKFDEGLRALALFRETHGHGLVPAAYPAQPLLAQFVENCRVAYKRGRLTDWQIDALEEMGCPVALGKLYWTDALRRYARFLRETGSVRVPADYERDRLLAMWYQRLVRRIKRGGVPEARRRELRILGFPQVA